MAGFRTFATGEVLTAANVNDFLMKQSVMVFADATARTAALGAEVAEGMLTYNEDTEQLEVFDGSAFVPAGSEPPAGIGSNVVSAVKLDQFSTTSTPFITVPGLELTITPSSATSKILLIGQVAVGGQHPGFRFTGGNSGTYVGNADGFRKRVVFGWQSTGSVDTGGFSMVFLDSPATTSPVTYSIEISRGQSATSFVNFFADNSNADRNAAASSLTAIEVAA